jgi:hypothetical protein
MLPPPAATALTIPPPSRERSTAQGTANMPGPASQQQHQQEQQQGLVPGTSPVASPVAGIASTVPVSGRATMRVGRVSSAEPLTSLDDSDRMRALAAHNASLYATPDLDIDMDSAMGLAQPAFGSTHSSGTSMDSRTPASSHYAPWDAQSPPSASARPRPQRERPPVKSSLDASADATARSLPPLGAITREAARGSAEGSARSRSGALAAVQSRRQGAKKASSADVGPGRGALGVIGAHRRGARPQALSAITGTPATPGAGAGGGSVANSPHQLQRMSESASPASEAPPSRPASQRLHVRVSRFRSQEGSFQQQGARTPSDGARPPSEAHRFPTLPAEQPGTARATIAAARQEAAGKLELNTPNPHSDSAGTSAGTGTSAQPDQLAGLSPSLDRFGSMKALEPHALSPQAKSRRRGRRLSLPSLASTSSLGALGVSTAQPSLKGSSLRFVAGLSPAGNAPMTASATLAPFGQASSKQPLAAGAAANPGPSAQATASVAGVPPLSTEHFGTESTVPLSSVVSVDKDSDAAKAASQRSLPPHQPHEAPGAIQTPLQNPHTPAEGLNEAVMAGPALAAPGSSADTTLNTKDSMQQTDSAQSSTSQAEVLVQAAVAGSVMRGVHAAAASSSGLPQSASAPVGTTPAHATASSRAVPSQATALSRPPRDPAQPRTLTSIRAARSSPALQGLSGSAGTHLPGLGAASVQGPLLAGKTGPGLAPLDRSAASGAPTSFHSRMRRARSLRVHTSSGAARGKGIGTGGDAPAGAAAAVAAAGPSSGRSVSNRGTIASSSVRSGMMIISSAPGARGAGVREFSSGGSSASASGRSSVTAGLDALSPQTAPPFNRGISGTSNITAGSSQGQSDHCGSDLDILQHDVSASLVDSEFPRNGELESMRSGSRLGAAVSDPDGLPVIVGKPKAGSARALG